MCESSRKNPCAISSQQAKMIRDAIVSAIISHPSRVMAISASYGGDFKEESYMAVAAFSSDASILVVAAITIIILWDLEKNILVVVIGSSLRVDTNILFQISCIYITSWFKSTTFRLEYVKVGVILVIQASYRREASKDEESSYLRILLDSRDVSR
ncbi:unnamed protein product [Lactuca saligna]|uniref:Uncharacterized protein n=1 Tax=Lactuca saligna TaxID=75948 RepID=A0AA36A5J7_LACSI|nr:unnamed protein product [Lactuca saligna]